MINNEERVLEEKRVPINEDDCIALQRSWYEYTGLKGLVEQFSSAETAFKPDMERYNYVLSSYLKALAYHDMLFNSVIRKYLKEDYDEYSTLYNIQVIFGTNEIALTQKTMCEPCQLRHSESH